jgi:hypothetical protein
VKILDATYFKGEAITIITTDEFEDLSLEDQLNILKDLIFDLRNMYSDKLKDHKLLNRKPTPKEQAFSRAMIAFNYRATGMTYKDVGKNMNISAVRARQLVNKAENILAREERWEKNGNNPV